MRSPVSKLIWVLILCLIGLVRAQDCRLPVSPAPSKSRLVFILDTSGSMQGLGNSRANIFAKVQGAILRGMRANQAPGSVELMTFDTGPRDRKSFAWPAQQQAFESTLNAVKADGSNTWLYSSMQSMFKSLNLQADTATTVYVLTDGIDNNPSKAATIQTALDAFNQIRGPFDKLYYVALGEKVPANVKEQFNQTKFARAVELAVNIPPDFSEVNLAPSIVDVGSDGSFPLKRPAGSQVMLDSPNMGGGQVSVDSAATSDQRVKLSIDGSVAAGSTGYLCVFPGGTDDQQINFILRFQRDTPPRQGEAVVPVDVLGTLVLLNPQVNRTLKPGQSTELRYKAVKGPVTVEVFKVPTELDAKLPDQVVSLLEGQEVTLKVTDKTMKHGQQVAPTLKLNNERVYPVPNFTGVVPKPFPWHWLALPLLLLIPLIFWLRRDRRPFDPYAVSVNPANLVQLHSENGRVKAKRFKTDQMDIGQAFKEEKLRGVQLTRFKPQPAPDDEVVLDNSDIQSIRRYTAQQMQRAAKLEAQPERLRLQKDKQKAGTFLQLEETLKPGLLYLFTAYTPPPQRVRPAAPPPEPPIEVIVTLLDGPNMQDHELPLEDVDLADVYHNENLRGLTVRREAGLLRLRALPLGMQLRHISRQFHPHDALPLAVMLDLSTPTGPYQLRIRDKKSTERMQR